MKQRSAKQDPILQSSSKQAPVDAEWFALLWQPQSQMGHPYHQDERTEHLTAAPDFYTHVLGPPSDQKHQPRPICKLYVDECWWMNDE